MNAVDLLLVVAIFVFAFIGWKRGFLYGLFSLVGFLIGASVGLAVAPRLLHSWQPGLGRAAVAIGIVFFAAIVGQLLFGYGGKWLSDRVTWRPAEVVDSAGGAVLSVLVMLLVAWLIAAMAVGVNIGPISRQVRHSSVLGTVDHVMPAQAQQAVTQLNDLLRSTGFPQVFAGLSAETIPPAAPPDPTVVHNPLVKAAQGSTVKLVSTAPSCSRTIEGSGFVFAPERVMTNAHVVAGSTNTNVEINGDTYSGTVVYFDPKVDLAVLDVPGLKAQPLVVNTTPPAHGDDVVVMGYPGGGPLVSQAARVRGVQQASGADIYGQSTVVREVISLRTSVHPGNSGGPVVDRQGRVIGIIVATSLDNADTAYAISMRQATHALTSGASASDGVKTGACT
jgi:S1-C subfamily serine protease